MLHVGPENDAYEREADRIAAAVTEAPGGDAPRFSFAQPAIQRTCAACAEEDERSMVRARALPGAKTPEAVSASPIFGELAGGRPLGAAERAFFEPRFGHRFDQVRVHADERAASLASDLHARAFTFQRDVFFGRGEYRPDTAPGRKLVAHELAHVVQQGVTRPGASLSPAAAGASPPAGPAVQRAVSPGLPRIRHDLTRSFTKWAVTDANAHDALMILKALNDTDLRDTVAAMEAEGLVTTLFDEVSDDDQASEAATLERIHRVRVHTETTRTAHGPVISTVTGSCDQAQTRTIQARDAPIKDWARRSKAAIDAFIADPTRNAATLTVLDRHFFHQATAGALTQAQQVAHARTISDNFGLVITPPFAVNWNCASQFDPLCRALAAAYVTRSAHMVTVCPSLFGDSETSQTYSLLHELMHAFANVDDRGYGSERVFAYLTPAQAINNADSYSLFAADVVPGAGGATSFRTTPRDSVADCSGPQEQEIRRSFAIAARMVTNALNIIGDPRLGAALVQTHFKTQDRVKLRRVIDRFKSINEAFSGSRNFECESSCDSGVATYYRRPGWTVHLCPPFFALATPAARENQLLAGAIAQAEGIRITQWSGTPGYASQTEDQAYENAGSYLGYARDVTTQWWP